MLLRWITRRFWPRIWATANKWLEDDGPTWAASLGYYAAFSFFPLVLMLISGAGFVLKFSHQAQLRESQLIEVIGQQTSKELAQQVGTLLNGVKSNATISGPVALATLVFAAIGIFTQLEAAFGRIWHVDADPNRKTGLWAVVRNVLFVRFRAFLMLLATGALVLLAFIASLVVSAIGHHAQEVPLGPTLFRLVPIGVGATLNTLCFTLLYRLLPKRPVLWRHAIAGALVAGIAWEIGRQLLALLLVGGSYTAYGVVGSLIVLMLWCNYGSMVLLFGAEYVEITGRLAANRRAAATPPADEGKNLSP
jgi:membrane protein